MALSERPDIPTAQPERPTPSLASLPTRTAQIARATDVLAIEARDRANEDPDTILLEPDAVAETSRMAELETWAEQNLPDMQPYLLAAQALRQIEQDEAAAGFSDFRVTDEIPIDLRPEVEVYLVEHALEQPLLIAQTQIDDGVPDKVPAEAGEQSRLVTRNDQLVAVASALNEESTALPPSIDVEATDKLANIERNETAQTELEALQVEFISLKAEIGTEAALRQILAKATIPEAQRHIRAVLGTIGLLHTALPDKAPALTRLLNNAAIDLSAATVTASFADVLSSAEQSPDFTPEDLSTLRQVIDKQEIYLRTGSHVQTELGQTQSDENGRIVPTHPEDDPLQFRDHVAGFTEPDGTQKLRAESTHGERVTLNITGWSGADVGRASELLQLWAITENEGQTDYLTSLTKLNWTDNARIDPLTLQQASQVVSAMLGGGEGHDGDIFETDEALGMIRWQAQLANPNGGTMRGHRDTAQTHDALQGLGIRDKHGRLNLDALRAFGEYSRDSWQTAPDYSTVQEHILKLR